mmetsp:Transcript_201/g.675  ORF Transcript_201/g.675 Transcript_201/m.675 type:complete len:105 (-) Transcript_201:971-1285(-)
MRSMMVVMSIGAGRGMRPMVVVIPAGLRRICLARPVRSPRLLVNIKLATVENVVARVVAVATLLLLVLGQLAAVEHVMVVLMTVQTCRLPPFHVHAVSRPVGAI